MVEFISPIRLFFAGYRSRNSRARCLKHSGIYWPWDYVEKPRRRKCSKGVRGGIIVSDQCVTGIQEERNLKAAAHLDSHEFPERPTIFSG